MVKVVKVVIVVPDSLCFSMQSLVLHQTSLVLLSKSLVKQMISTIFLSKGGYWNNGIAVIYSNIVIPITTF